ncbi:MAG: hypothetical protein HOK24_17275 [Desulfobacula sp.]|jgi:hypothetical protein|uniref:hypothetical protein n=1 Tax=Desulfobacula sp. TaxID=2593537 RepID=UPI001EC50860|nr:hypothetical protein [Desulfobacula sp.]MBT4873684.1 hypothetical protein [Desulfobacula sp.]MBT5546210.1 hypothetical protein [Desulfobacula sp.]
MKRSIGFLIFLFLLIPGLPLFECFAWECNNEKIKFNHVPSNYYGSGQYFSDCPGKNESIRCYHYHRHWICEKKETYFWDRNLDSAARAACGCNSPDDINPSAPAISKKPETRFHETER